MRSNKPRSRNKSNRSNNNRSVGNVVNRVFDSSGPEGKVRGTPQQIIEKYNQLARDSQLSGDRVATENFQQHAEHYLRLLGSAQKEQDARREQQERENRERQAERDRERAERQEREANTERPDHPERDSGGNQPASGHPVSSDPADAPQPDVIDAGRDVGGLVETPEGQPPVQPDSPPKRARRPRKKAPGNDGETVAQDSGGSDAPEAAE